MRAMKPALLSLAAALVLTACIGTDFIDNSQPRELRLVALPDTAALGDTVALAATYFNEVGIEEALAVEWSSADAAVFRIAGDGQRGIAVAAGTTTVTAEVSAGGETVAESFPVHVGAETVAAVQAYGGRAATTSSYPLSGDFTLTEEGGDLVLAFGDDYTADTRLPGLYVYLTNNPSTNVGAREIAKVTTFSGAHSYRIPGAAATDYSHVLYFCKPFSVKVGDGAIVEQ